MFSKMFKKSPDQSIPEQIYGILMAQSRSPEFFVNFGMKDAVMGRFDMLAMHVYLFNRRMTEENSKIASELSQEVFDLFVADIERALRQLGVGDTTVPKRKKKMVHSFYAQIEEFDPPLNAKEMDQLSVRIKTRYLADGEADKATALAEYMLAIAEYFEALPFGTIKKGQVNLPEVKQYV